MNNAIRRGGDRKYQVGTLEVHCDQADDQDVLQFAAGGERHYQIGWTDKRSDASDGLRLHHKGGGRERFLYDLQ